MLLLHALPLYVWGYCLASFLDSCYLLLFFDPGGKGFGFAFEHRTAETVPSHLSTNAKNTSSTSIISLCLVYRNLMSACLVDSSTRLLDILWVVPAYTAGLLLLEFVNITASKILMKRSFQDHKLTILGVSRYMGTAQQFWDIQSYNRVFQLSASLTLVCAI
jgi:hypothetical protein